MQQKMLSFESEKSLGPTGDAVFLTIRHRILTAQYAPRQLFNIDRFATSATIPKSLAVDVAQALVDHGYLTGRSQDNARIVHWDSQQFSDLIDACQGLIGLAIDKCMTRIDEEGLDKLREALAFSFRDPIDANQLEAFQIRWWIFFHTIISTIEVRNFRKMMLTGMPPALRRRVITSLSGDGLRLMLSDMTALIDALAARDIATGRELVTHQFSAFTTSAAIANEAFNGLAREDEVDYSSGALVSKPLFRADRSGLPDFHIGIREPLSWGEFKALDIAHA